MKLKEKHIIDSLITEALDADELSSLKNNLVTEENYENFLTKLLFIIINKDTTLSLLDFLKFNNLSSKFLFFQNKTTDVIEDLAELTFKGHESENIIYLEQSNNEIFQEHLQFLKETQNAIIFSERIELKKKLEKLDELNKFELTDSDIKTAITLYERQRLKKHFSELAKKMESEVEKEPTLQATYRVGLLPGGSDSKIINFNYKKVLRYAAILILVIGPALFIINKINNRNITTNDLAKNEIKKQEINKNINLSTANDLATNETKKQEINKNINLSTANDLATNETKKQPEPIKIEKEPFEFQLPIATSFSGECIIQEKTKFGFSSNDIKQVNITVVNLSNQIDAAQKKLHKEIKGNGARAKSIQNKLDILIALSETYTYSQGVIIIYSTRLQANSNTFTNIKLVSIEQNNNTSLYSKIFENYYFIIETKKNSKLIKETQEDVIERIKLIENKNE